jgi:hypothetical protein
MAVSLKRKLYSRGGSFETTIPIQLLFSLDLEKRHNVLFEFDKKTSRWYVVFEEDKFKEDKLEEKTSTFKRKNR